MSYDYREIGKWLIGSLPKTAHKSYVNLISLNRSFSEVFKDEMKYATSYEPLIADETIYINVPAFTKGFTYLLSCIGNGYMKIISASADLKTYTLHIKAEGGMPSRSEMAAISMIMTHAGFRLECFENEVTLTTDLTVRAVLSLYEGDPLEMAYYLNLDFRTFKRYEGK